MMSPADVRTLTTTAQRAPGCEHARQSWRCARCGRLLAKIVLGAGGSAETVCPKCDTINALTVADPLDGRAILCNTKNVTTVTTE